MYLGVTGGAGSGLQAVEGSEKTSARATWSHRVQDDSSRLRRMCWSKTLGQSLRHWLA